MKIIIVLLFVFSYIPNLQIINEGLIIHDLIAILVFLLLLAWNRLALKKAFVLITIFAAFLVLMLVAFNESNSWLILSRNYVYLSILILIRELIRKRGGKIHCENRGNSLLIKNSSFGLISIYIILDILQRIQYLPNIFQMDYYIRALGVPMGEDYYRYAWFDEHHVAAPALLSLSILFFSKYSFMLTWAIALFNGSRMIFAGSFLAIFCIFNLWVRFFALISSTVALMVIYNYSDFILNFNDLQLRLFNWGLHLSFIDNWRNILFGYGVINSTLEKIPIDNFLIRYICNLGVVGTLLPIILLIYIYAYSNLNQKFFISVFVGAAFFNDIFAYPPSLAVFSGSLALMELLNLRMAVSSPKRNTHLSGWKLRVDGRV